MSNQIAKVDKVIEKNGGLGRRGESTQQNPGPGFLKSGNYKFTLRPLLLVEYKYPGITSNLNCLFLLERLNEEDRKILEEDQSVGKKPTSKKQKESSSTKLLLPEKDNYGTAKDDNGTFSTPWREYEIVDGNHKLYVFQNK